MAIVLQATYAKKIGLPQYSSHQFTVALQSEIAIGTGIGIDKRSAEGAANRDVGSVR